MLLIGLGVGAAFVPAADPVMAAVPEADAGLVLRQGQPPRPRHLPLRLIAACAPVRDAAERKEPVVDATVLVTGGTGGLGGAVTDSFLAAPASTRPSRGTSTASSP